MNRNQQLEERLIEFGVLVIKVVSQLPDDPGSSHLGSQLIRSGTSPALNYGEALGAESRRDFIHKISVVLKELRETYNSLRILSRVNDKIDERVLMECNELIAIFVKTIKTSKKNRSDL